MDEPKNPICGLKCLFPQRLGRSVAELAAGHHPCIDTSLFKGALVELLGLELGSLEITSPLSGGNQGPESAWLVCSACSPHRISVYPKTGTH